MRSIVLDDNNIYTACKRAHIKRIHNGGRYDKTSGYLHPHGIKDGYGNRSVRYFVIPGYVYLVLGGVRINVYNVRCIPGNVRHAFNTKLCAESGLWKLL